MYLADTVASGYSVFSFKDTNLINAQFSMHNAQLL